MAGILISLSGIALCGWAGVLRERAGGDSPSQYSFNVGVPLAITAGVLSAVFNFALLAGEPLEKAALAAGASDLLKMNAIYPFSNGGAFITNFIWCVLLIARNRTGGQFFRLPEKKASTLAFYYLMALLSGAFWYFQFFFYGMGHAHMGTTYGFTSWALHMAMLILFSNVYGWLFREWEGVGPRPRRVLHLGMAVIVVATLIITYGNYLGEARRRRTESEDDDMGMFDTTGRDDAGDSTQRKHAEEAAADEQGVAARRSRIACRSAISSGVGSFGAGERNWNCPTMPIPTTTTISIGS